VGAVEKILAATQNPQFTHENLEDLIACLGALTCGYTEGLEALFAAAQAEGNLKTFGALMNHLSCEGNPPPSLQCLILEVFSDVCASSPQFKTWLIEETPMIKAILPQLLKSNAAEVRLAALQLACMIAEDDKFVLMFQKGDGLNALKSVLDRGSNPSELGMMLPDLPPDPENRRRAPSERQLAQCLMSKVLIF